MATNLKMLTAIRNDTRYELLRRIANADDGVWVCDFEAQSVSVRVLPAKHSPRLYTAQLVTRRKEGSWRYYEATETIFPFLETLDDLRGSYENF